MSLAEDRALLAARRWRGGRFVIAAAAIVFAGLTVGGTLPITYALAGFAIVAAAAVLAVRSGEEEDRLRPAGRHCRARRRSAARRRRRPAGSGRCARPRRPRAGAQRARPYAGAGAAPGRAGRVRAAHAGTDRGHRPRRGAKAKSSASSIPSACRSTAGSKPS